MISLCEAKPTIESDTESDSESVEAGSDELCVGPLVPDSAPFKGIRVLELASVVAAPSAGQYLAMLGADVIKVESTSGCMSRAFAQQVLPERNKIGRWSIMYDTVNRSKRGMAMDIYSEEGKETVKSLLSEADVMITCLNDDQLKKASLELPQLRQRYPSLVIASLTAWGASGPMSRKPGYDVGAFFAATGMSSLLVDDPRRTMFAYPLAFGDFTTGLALSTSLTIALANRHETGQGAIVSTSLLETGMWVLQPHINNCAPKPNLAYRHYETKDGEFIAICHQLDPDADAKLVTAVGAKVATEGAVQGCFSLLTSSEAMKALDAYGLQYVRMCSPFDVLTDPPPELTLKTETYPFAPEKCFPALPVSFSKSTRLPVGAPPELGSLNKQLNIHKDRLWKQRDASYEQFGSQAQRDMPLRDVKIVEYSTSASAAVSGACALFAELGATVVRVQTSAGQRLAQATGGETSWARQLHGQKTVCSMDQVAMHLREATLFVTDLPEPEREIILKQAGSSSMNQCSVLYFDPGKGALGWIAATSVGVVFRGWERTNPIPQVPFQLFDLCASFSITAAMATLLFHRKRVGASGAQLATVDHFATGAYLAQLIITAYQASTELAMPFGPMATNYTTEMQLDWSPLPSVTVVELEDGEFLFMLGADLKADLPKLLSCLGIKLRTYTQVIFQKLPLVLAGGCCGPRPSGKMEELSPIFSFLNQTLREELTKFKSAGEFDEWAQETDWTKYAFLTKSPTELLSNSHVKELGSFTSIDSKAVLVRAPIFFQGMQRKPL